MSEVKWYGEKVFDVYTKEINDRVLKVAFQIEAEAKRSMGQSTAAIMEGLRSGLISPDAIVGAKKLKRTKSGKFHLASLPGSPPNVDSGRLRASVSTNHSRSAAIRGKVGAKAKAEDGVGRPTETGKNFTAVVGTNVEYGRYLELGTQKMAARPWLRPAFEKVLRGAKSFIIRPVNK